MARGQHGQGAQRRGNAMNRQVFINGLPVINNLQAAADYAVNRDSYEFVTWSLYDSQSYPTTGIAQLTYFQQQVGGGTGVISAASKTLEDTNMSGNGALP